MGKDTYRSGKLGVFAVGFLRNAGRKSAVGPDIADPEFGIFAKIICPVITPALASWASITLITRWNDYFLPLLFLNRNDKYTLMISVSMLPSMDGISTPWQVILAGCTLVIIPAIVLYLCLQLLQKAGNLAGAVKG